MASPRSTMKRSSSSHSTETVTQLYERGAAAFAAFATAFMLRGNEVAPPAESRSRHVEAAVGEKVSRPDRFIRGLFEQSDGRLAYLWDTVAQLDSARAAFVLGLWMADPRVRVDRFKTLVVVNAAAYPEWGSSGAVHPPMHDFVTRRCDGVDPAGAPLGPTSRELWSRVFEADNVADRSATQFRTARGDAVDAAWLAATILTAPARQRADRLDQFASGSGCSRGPDSATPDVWCASCLSTLPHADATLERMDVRNPRLYAAAARQASRLAALDANRGFIALAQFQGGPGASRSDEAARGLDPATADMLVASLFAVSPNDDGSYAGAMAGLGRPSASAGDPPADDVEGALLAALAGMRASDSPQPLHLTWEGSSTASIWRPPSWDASECARETGWYSGISRSS